MSTDRTHVSASEHPNPQAGILIVDDESIIRFDLRERLTGLGYTVVGEAADGEAAVMLARRLQPDLVLMDIKMPKMEWHRRREHTVTRTDCAGGAAYGL